MSADGSRVNFYDGRGYLDLTVDPALPPGRDLPVVDTNITAERLAALLGRA